MEDDTPDPHLSAFYFIMKGVLEGYEDAHGDDENYHREAFFYALLWLLINHIRDYPEDDRLEILNDYKSYLDKALQSDDEYVPPIGTRH